MHESLSELLSGADQCGEHQNVYAVNHDGKTYYCYAHSNMDAVANFARDYLSVSAGVVRSREMVGALASGLAKKLQVTK